MNQRPKYLLSIATVALAAGLSVLLFQQLSTYWNSWKPASCLPSTCFCETIHPGAIKQPANAVSSFIFVFIGILIILATTTIRQRQSFQIVYGCALILVGFGSAFYHASLSYVGQLLDVSGMYLVATGIFIYALGRRKTLSQRIVVPLYIIMNGALFILQFHLPGTRRYLFALILVVALVLEYYNRREQLSRGSLRFMNAAIMTLGVAFGIWILDVEHLLCKTASFFQLHALWHILGALAAWFFFLYYQSQDDSAIATDNSISHEYSSTR